MIYESSKKLKTDLTAGKSVKSIVVAVQLVLRVISSLWHLRREPTLADLRMICLGFTGRCILRCYITRPGLLRSGMVIWYCLSSTGSLQSNIGTSGVREGALDSVLGRSHNQSFTRNWLQRVWVRRVREERTRHMGGMARAKIRFGESGRERD